MSMKEIKAISEFYYNDKMIKRGDIIKDVAAEKADRIIKAKCGIIAGGNQDKTSAEAVNENAGNTNKQKPNKTAPKK